MEKETILRLLEQERREAENRALDSATDMRGFVKMRQGLRNLVLHPDLPLEQQTAADYVRIKNQEIDPWTKRRK